MRIGSLFSGYGGLDMAVMLDQPQNLENALARLPGASTAPLSPDGSASSDDHPQSRQCQEPTDDPDSLPLSWNG